jgi:hypothetical protein
MEWIRTKLSVPNVDTMYANEKGVPVICDVGSPVPVICTYTFLEKAFVTISYGPRGVKMTPVRVRKWMPLPRIVNAEKKS